MVGQSLLHIQPAIHSTPLMSHYYEFMIVGLGKTARVWHMLRHQFMVLWTHNRWKRQTDIESCQSVSDVIST